MIYNKTWKNVKLAEESEYPVTFVQQQRHSNWINLASLFTLKEEERSACLPLPGTNINNTHCFQEISFSLRPLITFRSPSSKTPQSPLATTSPSAATAEDEWFDNFRNILSNNFRSWIACSNYELRSPNEVLKIS